MATSQPRRSDHLLKEKGVSKNTGTVTGSLVTFFLKYLAVHDGAMPVFLFFLLSDLFASFFYVLLASHFELLLFNLLTSSSQVGFIGKALFMCKC